MIWKSLPPRLTRVLAATVLIGAVAAPASAVTAAASPASGEGGAVAHDVTFVAMMVPHHEMGIEMAEVAEKRASRDKVRQLATRIDQVQTDQVGEMKDWLERHDAEPMEPPEAVREMEQQDLEMLGMLMGHHFDAMFLMMMRSHHAQAVSEAEDELHHGRSEFALRMAREIKAGQLKEIAYMNGLLAALHGQMHPDMAA